MVFSGTPVSSTNKTDRHDLTEILLKVALNTITLTLTLLVLVDGKNSNIIIAIKLLVLVSIRSISKKKKKDERLNKIWKVKNIM